MTDGEAITVVVPMLNEEASAAAVVGALFAAFGGTELELHVVCVNDGSTDRTQQLLEKLAQVHPRMTICRHDKRRGYGAAIRTGLQAAQTSLVGWMDGDGQYEPSDIRRLIESLGTETVGAIGVRTYRADGPHRRILGRAGSILASLLCRHRLADIDAGLKVFDSRRVDLTDLKSNGGYISTEALQRALRCGGVKQIPIVHQERTAGTPTGASPRVLSGLLVDFVRCTTTSARKK